MGEQFCLKWNNHQSTLISLFDTLLETEKHVDCSLSAEGKVLRAHKVVLSACSPYLEELLNQHQDKYPILVFSDIKYEELKAMLDYMYRGEVNVLQEQLNGFLKAAETLQIKGLTDQGGGGGDTGGGGGSGGGAAAPAGSKRKPSVASELPSAAPQEQAAPTPKRRRARRHSQESDNSHVESGNSCDAPPLVTKAETETPRLPPVTPTPPVHTAPKLEPPEMIQPKTEYIEEMNNDDQIEDLTLDDDDEDDSYMAKPSSSHGDNSQGYDTNWQFSGDTSNSEMFMAQQDPSGNQSNSQDVVWAEENWDRIEEAGLALLSEMPPHEQQLGKLEISISKHNSNPTSFDCPHCPFKAKHKSSLKCHLVRKHGPATTVNTIN